MSRTPSSQLEDPQTDPSRTVTPPAQERSETRHAVSEDMAEQGQSRPELSSSVSAVLAKPANFYLPISRGAPATSHLATILALPVRARQDLTVDPTVRQENARLSGNTDDAPIPSSPQESASRADSAPLPRRKAYADWKEKSQSDQDEAIERPDTPEIPVSPVDAEPDDGLHVPSAEQAQEIPSRSSVPLPDSSAPGKSSEIVAAVKNRTSRKRSAKALEAEQSARPRTQTRSKASGKAGQKANATTRNKGKREGDDGDEEEGTPQTKRRRVGVPHGD